MLDTMTTAEIAQHIYVEIFDLDDTTFRSAKLGEIEDWLNEGDLHSSTTLGTLVAEWREYDAEEIAVRITKATNTNIIAGEYIDYNPDTTQINITEQVLFDDSDLESLAQGDVIVTDLGPVIGWFGADDEPYNHVISMHDELNPNLGISYALVRVSA